jgi:hypothetical protein
MVIIAHRVSMILQVMNLTTIKIMAKGITVDQLAKMCLKLSAQGLGGREIIMSSDDECNEYHQAWEGLHDGAEFADYVDDYQLSHCISQDICNYVVLT